MIITELIAMKYNKWRHISFCICGKDEFEDILHEVIIKLNDVDPDKITDSYVGRAIRNTFYNLVTRDRYDDKERMMGRLKFIEDDEKGVEYYEDEYRIERLKIDCINEVVNGLNSLDIKLFNLHFLYNYSQREIGRIIELDSSIINRKINKIKKIIIDSYERKQH